MLGEVTTQERSNELETDWLAIEPEPQRVRKSKTHSGESVQARYLDKNNALKDPDLEPIFRLLDGLVHHHEYRVFRERISQGDALATRTAEHLRKTYLQTFLNLANATSGRELKLLWGKVDSLEARQLSEKECALVTSLKEILHEIEDWLPQNILQYFLNTLPETEKNSKNRYLFKDVLENKRLEYDAHHSTDNGGDTFFTFVYEHDSDRAQVEELIRIFLDTWTTFTWGNRHDALFSKKLGKRVTIPVILLQRSDAPDAPRVHRSFAFQSQKNPGVFLYLDSPNPEETTIHEAVHQVLSAYFDYNHSLDITEGIATLMTTILSATVFNHRGGSNLPSAQIVSIIRHIAEEHNEQVVSTTQVLELFGKNGLQTEQERAEWTDIFQYSLGYYLFLSIANSRQFQSLLRRYEQLRLPPLDAVMRVHYFYNQAAVQMRKDGEEISNRSLLHTVITSRMYLGWGEEAYQEIVVALNSHIQHMGPSWELTSKAIKPFLPPETQRRQGISWKDKFISFFRPNF